MSKPKILEAINELDENGFYNKSTYLGDIRITSNCLDDARENGIYAFTGGSTAPTDNTGDHKWILVVHASQDLTSIEQLAVRLDNPTKLIVYFRQYNNNNWSNFTIYKPAIAESLDMISYDGSGLGYLIVAGTGSTADRLYPAFIPVTYDNKTNKLDANIAGIAAKAIILSTARTINGMSFDGSADRSNYGSCSTAAGTNAKTVSCKGFTLVTGAEITVKFLYTNTASNPTLNVNSTGAKSIYYKDSAIASGVLVANGVYTFRYDGTNYNLVGTHDVGDKMPISGGTFTGNVMADSNSQDPNTMLLRNSKLSLTAEDPTVNGEIVWVYK